MDVNDNVTSEEYFVLFCQRFGELIRDSYSSVARSRFLSMQARRRGNDLIEGFVAMNIYSWASLTSQRFCHFLSSIESRRESQEKDKFLERILYRKEIDLLADKIRKGRNLISKEC